MSCFIAVSVSFRFALFVLLGKISDVYWKVNSSVMNLSVNDGNFLLKLADVFYALFCSLIMVKLTQLRICVLK